MGHVTAAFSQTNFRFRNDDGSQTGATWQATQNTDITPDVQSDFPTRLRIMIQETAGGSANNNDITLQYQKNGGTWTAVDGSSTNIDFRTSSFVSNQATTTSQLTGGTGSFVTGTFISADASAARISFSGNDHTELEYSLVALSANLADGDVINFRVLINGSTMTYSQTPTLTVTNNNSPTVALNSPTDTGTITDTTPTLSFTGTDSESDAIRYNVQIDTVNTFDSQSSEIVDEYDDGGSSPMFTIHSGNPTARGQSFTGDGTAIKRLRVYMSKSGSPTGSVTAKIYAHTGTYGSSSVPTGSALATSDVVNVSALSGSKTSQDFVFSSPPSLANGTNYVFAIEYTGGNSSNYVAVAWDASSPTHAGNACTYSGSWAADSGADIVFTIYSGSPLLNKTSGTDAGFSGSPDNTDPFTSGQQVDYTVQAGDALSADTYYWRVRGIDPSGSNTYGAWSSTRSFTVNPQAPPTVALNTADATEFGLDSTPTLDFTGTDPQSDDIRYNVQIAPQLADWHDFGFSDSWLADDLSTGSVSSWTNGQGGTPLTQANGSLQPAQSATSGANSQPGVTFDGTDDYLQAAIGTKSQPQTYIVIYRNVSNGSFEWIFDSMSSTNRQLLGQNSSSQWEMFAGTVQVAGTVDTNWHAALVYYNGASSVLELDDTNIISADPGSQTLGTGITIASRYDGNSASCANVVISAIGVYNGDARNDSDWQGLVNYVQNKWGLTLGTQFESPPIDVVSGTDSGFSGSPDNTDPFTSGQQVSYTVQAGDALDKGTYYWRVRGSDPSGSNTYGSWSTTRSFTVGLTESITKSLAYEVVTADSVTKSLQYRTARTLYSYGTDTSLPTDSNSMENYFTEQNYTDVATDDNVYVDSTQADFNIKVFKYRHGNNTDEITLTWKGKTTLAPTSSTVYLQIYNHNSTAWETLDSDNTTAADTEFTLTGTQSTNLTNYYNGSSNEVTARLYQEVV